ncbi:hypothetical protein [Streptomyces liangshanensis]|uniref:hypothetical protein n=1 Tax=Streptomyces liangshanensis TaxID=2717324 RepID=UPI0036DE3F03
MHGHGYVPPQRPRDGSAVIVLRVFFALAAVLSCGFLAWVPMLRLAILTRKARDSVLLAVTIGMIVLSVVMIGTDNTEDLTAARSDVGVALLLLTAVAVLGYYLYAEIAHFHRRDAQAAHPRPAPFPVPPQPGYGYPHSGMATPPPAPRPHVPPPPAVPPAHYPANTARADTPHPDGPATGAPRTDHSRTTDHPRIDQVRAELDELSDFLRSGNSSGNSNSTDKGQDGR